MSVTAAITPPERRPAKHSRPMPLPRPPRRPVAIMASGEQLMRESRPDTRTGTPASPPVPVAKDANVVPLSPEEEDVVTPGKLSRSVWRTPDVIDVYSKGWVARVLVGAVAAIALVVTGALLYYLADIDPNTRATILKELLDKLLWGLMVVGVVGVVGHYFRRRK